MANDFEKVALDTLQRQFGYTNVSDLMMKRAAVWDKHIGRFSETFVNEILNFDTCIPEALDYFWGKKYKISRTFTDNDGNLFTLSNDTFREIIKIRAFGSRWNGSIAEMNEFLGNLFKDRGKAFINDPQDMTTEVFLFLFSLTPEELYLFKNKDILPRPAGVGVGVSEFPTGKVFGFVSYDNQRPSFRTGFRTYDNPDKIGGMLNYSKY